MLPERRQADMLNVLLTLSTSKSDEEEDDTANSAFNEHQVVVALAQVSSIVAKLGPASDSMYKQLESSIVPLLKHRSRAARLEAAVCLRTVGIALPSRLTNMILNILMLLGTTHGEIAIKASLEDPSSTFIWGSKVYRTALTPNGRTSECPRIPHIRCCDKKHIWERVWDPRICPLGAFGECESAHKSPTRRCNACCSQSPMRNQRLGNCFISCHCMPILVYSKCGPNFGMWSITLRARPRGSLCAGSKSKIPLLACVNAALVGLCNFVKVNQNTIRESPGVAKCAAALFSNVVLAFDGDAAACDRDAPGYSQLTRIHSTLFDIASFISIDLLMPEVNAFVANLAIAYFARGIEAKKDNAALEWRCSLPSG